MIEIPIPGDFAARHGEFVNVHVGNVHPKYIFQDGAVVTADGLGVQLHEPANGPARLDVQMQFVRKKIEKEEKDFMEYKTAILQWIKDGRGAPGAAEKLTQGKARVVALRERLAALQAERDALPEARRAAEERARQAAALQAQQEQQAQLAAEINAIDI